MSRTHTAELVGKDSIERLSLQFQLTELKESRNVMLERIVKKVSRGSSMGIFVDTSDFESEICHLKDYGLKLAWR